MGAALEAVNRFYESTLDQGDADAIADLVDPTVVFAGPLQKTEGAAAYVDLNRQLVPLHMATRMKAQFEHDDQVCSIYELDLRTPAGDVITLEMADWITVSAGRIASQAIYYDPRAFAAAFGL